MADEPLPWPPRRTSVLTVYKELFAVVVGALFFVVEVLVESAVPVDTGTGSAAERTIGLVWTGVAIVVGAGIRIVAWSRRTYALGVNELRIEQGLFTRQAIAVPYHRIQQVGTRQQVFDQVLGVSRLTVQTAGAGASAAIELSALRKEDAEQVRRVLLRRQVEMRAAMADQAVQTATATPGVGAMAPPGGASAAGAWGGVGAAQPPAWAPPPPRVELLRLTDGQLARAGLASAPTTVVLPVIALVVAVVGLVTAPVTDGSTVLGMLAAAGGLVAVAFLVAMLAMLTTVMTFHGYTLSSEGDELHLRHGLFDVREVSVPRRRVQWISIDTHLVQRAFGVCSVSLRSAAPAAVTGGAPTNLTIPWVPRADVIPLLQRLMGDNGWEVPVFAPRPASAKRRAIVRRTVPFVLAIAGAAIWEPLALLALPLSGLGVWWGLVAHRRAGHGWSARVVALSSGALHHTVRLVALDRVQSARASTSPFQRLAGLATLGVDVAGAGAPHLADLDASIALRLAQALPSARPTG